MSAEPACNCVRIWSRNCELSAGMTRTLTGLAVTLLSLNCAIDRSTALAMSGVVPNTTWVLSSFEEPQAVSRLGAATAAPARPSSRRRVISGMANSLESRGIRT